MSTSVTPIGYRPNTTLRNTFFFPPDKQNQMLINRNLLGRDVLLISEITAGSSWLDGRNPSDGKLKR